ncbi:MAG TPA: bifunctional oligoribonuclease/PAP phosphatase NrnA [Longimicrobiales bacterium]|nr:bifunctional oligoribonuclease/PAP phosphatase NrnA [Longimicrobiales bacterium]
MARSEEETQGGEASAHYANYGNIERARAFAEFLNRHRGERHLVVMQDFPDPDAISSALAYRMLARTADITTDIAYEGRVSHQENLALVNLLDIELTRVTDTFPLKEYDGAVYIDNQGTTTRLTDRLAVAGVPALAVLDHHAHQGLISPEFSDIRAVGAAATILVDYIQSGEIVELDPTQEDHVRLATALVHGLRSETSGFIRAGAEEYMAGAFLSRFIDVQLLESILRVQRSRGTMEVIRAALTDRTVRGGFSLAGVGYLRHADRDAVPQAAEFLLSEENVHTAIVYGILLGEGEREVVVGSVRTSKLTLDVDEFLKTALGSDFRGRYYGGGRNRAGGFEIPTGFLEGNVDEDQMQLKWDAFNRQIRAKLLSAVGLANTEGEA